MSRPHPDKHHRHRDLDGSPPSISVSPSSLFTTPNSQVMANVSAFQGSAPGPLALSIAGPPGSTFTPSGSTGSFQWTPNWSQVKSWTATFTVTDSAGLTASAQANISVVDYGPSLSLSPSSLYTTPNSQVTASVTAQSGSPNTTLSLGMQNGPAGATFTPTGNNSGTFQWTPNWSQVRSWTIAFTATDPAMMSSTAQLNVNVVDYGPTVSVSPSSQFTAPNNPVTASVTAQSGSPNTTLSLGMQNGPAGATFTPTGNNSGTFQWTPNWSQVRSWTISFTATDPASMTSTTQFNVNVVDYGPTASVSPSTLNLSVGGPGTAAVLAQSNSPNTTLSLTMSGPAGATFTTGPNNTGTFLWTPTAAGSSTATFTATDPASMTGSTQLSINVFEMEFDTHDEDRDGEADDGGYGEPPAEAPKKGRHKPA